MTKWGSRFALGLSTSVPACRVAQHDIRHEDDISLSISFGLVDFDLIFLSPKVSPTGSDMTDGCGYINKFPLCMMQMKYEWDSFPTAIQCRLAGSKVRRTSCHGLYLTLFSYPRASSCDHTQEMMSTSSLSHGFGPPKSKSITRRTYRQTLPCSSWTCSAHRV